MVDALSIGRISLPGHENRNSVFSGQHINTANMIRMLMGYEDTLQTGHGKPQPGHPFHHLLRTDAGIYKNGAIVIADIITIAVTSGRYRCNIQSAFFPSFPPSVIAGHLLTLIIQKPRFKHLLQNYRNRRFKMHAFTGCRVEKFQNPGMKP
jgi:hypothetical protein